MTQAGAATRSLFGHVLLVAAAILGAGLPAYANGARLDVVRSRGALVCGLAAHSPGFSVVDPRGTWSGIDVDFCRALAAAVLGDGWIVKPLTVAPAEQSRLLASGDIDILATSTAITLNRAFDPGVVMPAIVYYEPMGVLVHRQQAITSIRELSGATLCTGSSPATRLAISDFFRGLGMPHQIQSYETWESRISAYRSGRCQALVADVSMLAAARVGMPDAADHLLLPEAVSVSPLSPSIRSGDPAWAAIVKWVKHALVASEQHGITQANVKAMRASPHPEVRRLLGVDDDVGKPLGLARTWVASVIAAVGHYGEIIERNVGKRSSFKLERRLNELWLRGGLHVAPAFR